MTLSTSEITIDTIPPNLYDVNALPQLPLGICVKPEGHKSATETLGSFTQTLLRRLDPRNIIAGEPSLTTLITDSRTTTSPLIMTYCHLASQLSRLKASGQEMPLLYTMLEKVVNELLVNFPNLAFLRGGSVEIQENVAVLDGYGLGVNGYLGDAEALKWVYQGYAGSSRCEPCLIVVAIDNLIEAAKERILRVVSEHFYDLSLWRETDATEGKYLDWCRNSVKVFRFTEEKGGDLKRAEMFLSNNAVEIRPANNIKMRD